MVPYHFDHSGFLVTSELMNPSFLLSKLAFRFSFYYCSRIKGENGVLIMEVPLFLHYDQK